MRKVTKILLRTLSAIILLLIIFPLLLALLLATPTVQNIAIDKAATLAGDYLGTKVSVGRITVGLLNRVAVRDFYVEDWDGDTLLYVKRADAYLASLASLAKKNLVINYGKIQGGKFVVRETDRGTFAVKEITDQLVNRERKSGFRLDVRSVDGSDIDFSLIRKDDPRDVGIDFANMHLLGIDTHIDNLSVDDGAVAGDIRRISFVERSGFALDDMNGYFLVDDGQIEVKEAYLKTVLSEINLDYLLLDGKNWLEYRDFINKVPIICTVSDSRVSSDDVGYFAPTMWGWQTTVRNASISMNGPVANFSGKVLHATLEDGGVLKGSARVRGLIDVERTHFDINVDKLRASTEEITYLLNTIAHLTIGEKAAQYVERVKSVDASGRFRGTIRKFTAELSSSLSSGGDVQMSCSMLNPANGRKMVNATVAGKSVDLSQLLANEIIGDATFVAETVAELGDGAPVKLIGGADIDSIFLNGYNYKSLAFRTEIENNYIEALFDTNDEALRLKANAGLNFSDKSLPVYDAKVLIEHADLNAMNINRRDSISVLSADVELNANGTSFDDLNGKLQIANAAYQTVGRGCETDLVELSMKSNEDARTLELSSEFADAVFESRTAYKNVVYYLKNLLAQYTPMFYDAETRQNINEHIVQIGDERAALSVTTKYIDPLLNCITDDIEMSEGSKVEMIIKPLDRYFELRASSEYTQYRNYLVTNININAGNVGDSLSMSMAADDMYAGLFHFSGVEVNGGAKDNVVDLSAIFADSVRDIRGDLSATARVSRKGARRNLAIKFNPTHIYSGEDSWNITTDGIDIDSERVDIRRFAVRSDDQELFVNGIASRNDRDSVYMNLKNFSLAPLTQLTSILGYKINGKTNGYATVHSALNDTRVDARIEMDSVNISGVDVPNVLLTSQWDFGRSQASLDISTRADNKRVIEGYFAPSQMRYYARMRTEGVKMNLLDPLLESVIRDTEGSASVDLTISGQQRNAELRGEIKVDSLATTVDYTHCRYTVPSATIKVENNRLIAGETPVFDRNGQRGDMTLDVSLQHLSNIKYDVGLRVYNMEVLNTTERDNPMFYGSIFATGSGTIKGDKAGVMMDFDAHSNDNSKFYMPLTDDGSVANADFLTFATKERDTTSYLVRKKLLFENRQKLRTSGGNEMDIKMALDVRPNTEVQLVIDPTVGDIIKGTGEGKLDLHINPQANIFTLNGTYTIEKGSYLFTLQNVINKWFDIESGSKIQWTGEPLDAILDIDAVYRLKASLQPLLEGSITESNRSTRAVPVECFIHLTDRLTQPTVTFDIEVPSADLEVQNIIASALATPESKSQQFLYLIIANSFISESTNSMSSSIGASATAATGFEMLSNQFSNWLSSDDYKIVLRYRPRTEQMSDEVDFGFSKGLIDNRLLIEVEGNYIVDRTQMVNSTSNFTGEAYLTWLIDRAGTLRLKGFTHTIDRFDENQGLQETGVGIYFKEDFNDAKHLRRRLKNRFKREKRDETQKQDRGNRAKKQQKIE